MRKFQKFWVFSESTQVFIEPYVQNMKIPNILKFVKNIPSILKFLKSIPNILKFLKNIPNILNCEIWVQDGQYIGGHFSKFFVSSIVWQSINHVI